MLVSINCQEWHPRVLSPVFENFRHRLSRRDWPRPWISEDGLQAEEICKNFNSASNTKDTDPAPALKAAESVNDP